MRKENNIVTKDRETKWSLVKVIHEQLRLEETADIGTEVGAGRGGETDLCFGTPRIKTVTITCMALVKIGRQRRT